MQHVVSVRIIRVAEPLGAEVAGKSMRTLRQSMRLLVSLLLAVTAAGHAAGLGICVSADGHAAVELVPPEGCCAEESGGQAPRGASFTRTTACGPCVDYEVSTPGVLARCLRAAVDGGNVATVLAPRHDEDAPSVEPSGDVLPPGAGPLPALRAVRVLR